MIVFGHPSNSIWSNSHAHMCKGLHVDITLTKMCFDDLQTCCLNSIVLFINLQYRPEIMGGDGVNRKKSLECVVGVECTHNA